MRRHVTISVRKEELFAVTVQHMSVSRSVSQSVISSVCAPSVRDCQRGMVQLAVTGVKV